MFNQNKLNERLDTLQKMTPEELAGLKRKAHICAIEDCMKAKRLLAGFGIKGHDIVLNSPGDVFDSYYNCDTETLHVELESLTAEANKFVQALHFMSLQSMNENISRELREDEQDTED